MKNLKRLKLHKYMMYLEIGCKYVRFIIILMSMTFRASQGGGTQVFRCHSEGKGLESLGNFPIFNFCFLFCFEGSARFATFNTKIWQVRILVFKTK